MIETNRNRPSIFDSTNSMDLDLISKISSITTVLPINTPKNGENKVHIEKKIVTLSPKMYKMTEIFGELVFKLT